MRAVEVEPRDVPGEGCVFGEPPHRPSRPSVEPVETRQVSRPPGVVPAVEAVHDQVVVYRAHRIRLRVGIDRKEVIGLRRGRRPKFVRQAKPPEFFLRRQVERHDEPVVAHLPGVDPRVVGTHRDALHHRSRHPPLEHASAALRVEDAQASPERPHRQQPPVRRERKTRVRLPARRHASGVNVFERLAQHDDRPRPHRRRTGNPAPRVDIRRPPAPRPCPEQ